MTGCNLRCSYCDTEYAFYEGREMSPPEVLQAISGFPTKLVLLTGGEPMLQKAIHELFAELLRQNYTVCLETGGQVPLDQVDRRVHKIMDLKCPSSGIMHHNRFDNIPCLGTADEVKFVIGDRGDFDWARGMVQEFNLVSRLKSVLFSPVYSRMPYDLLARWILDSGLQVRLQLQLHKIIWPNVSRGV